MHATKRDVCAGILRALSAIVTALTTVGAHAADVPPWPTWSLRVAPATIHADTVFRAATAVQPNGTVVDLESSLGLSERRRNIETSMVWRPAPRHRIGLAHFSVERSGQATLSGELRFADQAFSAGTALRSRIDTRVTAIDYAYSLWQVAGSELSLGLGVHRIDLAAELRTLSGDRSAAERASLVAPTLRLGGAWSPANG